MNASWWNDPEYDNLGRKFRAETPETCKGCGAETYSGQRMWQSKHDTCPHDSGYCEKCRTNCPICEDWLMGELVVELNGKPTHRICAEEHIAEHKPSLLAEAIIEQLKEIA